MMITPQHHRYEEQAVSLTDIPCPSCWIGSRDQATAAVGRFYGEYGYDVAPAVCPTCSVASVEWGLVEEMDTVLKEILGVTRVEAGIGALD